MTAPYVVIDEVCPTCKGDGAYMDTTSHDWTRKLKCKTCHGAGTVQRRVTCETCRHFDQKTQNSWCYANEIIVDPSWGCVAWEAKP